MRTFWPVLALFLPTIALAEEACKLNPDPGPCEAAIQRWFYNATTKECESFTYGGCDGVVPFQTERACDMAKCDPCVKIPETGPCKALFKKWFFDNRRGTFTWGGCDGVVPFDTLKKCKQERCEPKRTPRASPKPLKERCSVAPDAGPCRRNLVRWFWDADTQTCKSFRYGGCFGRVPFRWLRQCKKAKCRDLCRAEPDAGPCDWAFVRWFYNGSMDRCESFSWGGCGGTVPFVTRTECEGSTCVKDRCVLEPNSGPCKAIITKYFYNQATGVCESFRYGGCRGLVPFDTRADCDGAKCVSDRCKLQPETGPCGEELTKWWFNGETGKCEKFMWGGCGGRVPFDTEEECGMSGCVADKCRLVPDSGFCRAFFLKWFWNEAFGRCESFIWGGCGGVVPFDTKVECEAELCAGVYVGNNEQVKA